MSAADSRESEALLQQLECWLKAQEGEHFEFKEAKNSFSGEKLAKYSAALANEGGGKVVLGVSDRRPRLVVGTQAFKNLEGQRRKLMERIPLRIEAIELDHPDGRVVVFDVPAHPVGVPIKQDGVYWCRRADSLVPMSEDQLRAIFAESGHDFSADICPGARLDDLDPAAIEDFRRRWFNKSGNEALLALDHCQLLRDAEVLLGDQVTYAALILFGTRESLGRFLAQAEVVFEFRSSEVSGPAQKRLEFRQGFFCFYDELWEFINLRNDVQHYQDGLFVLDIPTFEERSVREAVLNAVSHRNYQLGGNVFVRQYPRRLVVESPGGFPVGITPDNVLDRQSPRNRRIADAFSKCGLVERSGQGMNLMFEQSIRHGKLRPSLDGTDEYNVVITLRGEIQDQRFLQFLHKVGRETLASFSTHDFLTVDLVHREESVPDNLRDHLRRLIDLGVVESVGRGRGTRYMLSRHYYSLVGKRGAYTRRRGLDHETHKELLLKHLRETPDGSALAELHQILPQLSRRKVQALLRELRDEDRVVLKGTRRWARWQATKDPEEAGGA